MDMHKILAFAISLIMTSVASAEPPFIHSMTDISQEFSFYMDGRFHRQYIKELGVMPATGAACTWPTSTTSIFWFWGAAIIAFRTASNRWPTSAASWKVAGRFC